MISDLTVGKNDHDISNVFKMGFEGFAFGQSTRFKLLRAAELLLLGVAQ